MDTQWRHKSKISEKLGRCCRRNMLRPYLKIWEWEWIFGRAVKANSSLGVRSPCPVRSAALLFQKEKVCERSTVNWKILYLEFRKYLSRGGSKPALIFVVVPSLRNFFQKWRKNYKCLIKCKFKWTGLSTEKILIL